MSEFIQRQIGSTPKEQSKMLEDLGVSTQQSTNLSDK